MLQSDKKKVVDSTEGRLWADSHGFLFFETSAFNGDGIQDMFQVTNLLQLTLNWNSQNKNHSEKIAMF